MNEYVAVTCIVLFLKGQQRATVWCYARKSLHKLTNCIYNRFFTLVVSSENGLKVGKSS